MSENTLSNQRIQHYNQRNVSPFKAVPISGITPFTTIDFPGKLACVFYTQGCPWRCLYCHNSSLLPFERKNETVTPEKLLKFLESRQGLLDGVVFSGGEPTVHRELGSLMACIRSMGFKIALHTNGVFPERLKTIIPLCDWIGMDVKAPLDRYDIITQVKGSERTIEESIRMIVASGVGYEFRTTVHPILLSDQDIERIAVYLAKLGVTTYALQAFRAEGCNNEKLNSYQQKVALFSPALHQRLSELIPHVILRQ